MIIFSKDENLDEAVRPAFGFRQHPVDTFGAATLVYSLRVTELWPKLTSSPQSIIICGHTRTNESIRNPSDIKLGDVAV